jgi:hypothetical protein
MGADDRKRLFWYLKRKTSYTAWGRAAEEFDAFAEIFKKQVIEEPITPGGIFGGTEWEKHYIEILRAQVFFEQGLFRLRKGDRSVWLYNDRGVLRDALMIANLWYAELMFGGERYDHEYQGKYLEELKRAIKRYFDVSEDAGYVQPMMVGSRSPLFWGEFLECILNNQTFPRTLVNGVTPTSYGAPLVYPSPLPDVPESIPDQRVYTGEAVTSDGVYEPLVKDGCMNYLLKDTSAPPLAVEGGSSRPVVWKLIWQDNRYVDGQIPVEERLYFPPEVLKTTQPSFTVPDVVSALTGEIASRDGTWAVMDELKTKLVCREGEKMPPSQGRDVTWVWLDKP